MRGAGIAVACVAMVLFALAMQMPQYTALESLSIDDALKQPATDHIMESPQTHLHMAALSPHSMTAGTEQQIHEWHEPKSDLKIKAAHADEVRLNTSKLPPCSMSNCLAKHKFRSSSNCALTHSSISTGCPR